MTGKERYRSGSPRWISWLIYLLLSILMTWPLAQHAHTHFGGLDQDQFNVYWGNWWVRESLTNLQNPYVTEYLIYPIGFNLVTFAFSPFLALLWIPLSWLTYPITAYNLITWASILFCCLAMDELVRYLTGNGWVALVAGLTFAFAPRLVAERAAHLNMATVAWLPLVALLLTRLMREARVRDVILLAVSILLAFLTRMQVGILTLLFDGVYFVGLALVERKKWHRLAVRRLLLAGLLSLLLISPLLILTWQALQQPGGDSLLRWDAEQFQADLLAYVLPPPQHPLFGSWTETIYQQRFEVNTQYWAYAGLVPLLLAAYAIITRPRQALPWLLVSLVFFVLALGPHLRLNGKIYQGFTLPYGWAQGLFTTIGLNWPNRLNLALMAGLAVLVGLASAEIVSRSKKNWLLVIPGLLILGEFLVVPIPVQSAPFHSPFYEQMAADGEDYAIADLPLTREASEIHRYYQTVHHKPMVGGWDHRVLPESFAFIDANPLLGTWRGKDQPDVTLDEALVHLSRAGVRYLVLHKDQLGSVPERTRDLLLVLAPDYEDQSIYVLPVDAASSQENQVVHHFNNDVALLYPFLFTSLVPGIRIPQLSLSTCWLAEAQGSAAGEWQVSLTAPDGALVYRETASLPPSTEPLQCKHWSLQIGPPFHSGPYRLIITQLAEGQPTGTYTATMPIQVLQTRKGEQFPTMGTPFPGSFNGPMELLGYNLEGGSGLVWIDLFFRSTAKHEGIYFLEVYLLDPQLGLPVASSRGIVPKDRWKEGDLLQERRVLWLNDVPPGLYSIGLELIPQAESPVPGSSSQDVSGEPWSPDMLALDTAVLVLPKELQGTPFPEQGRFRAYTAATEVNPEPPQRTDACFEGVAQLEGYSLEPGELGQGEEFEIMLYWVATNEQPLSVDYTVFVHLVDDAGQIVAQHDGQPLAGRWPTHTWQKGDRIIDTHTVEWQDREYAGTASIRVGLYDAQTLQRLPAHDSEDRPLPSGGAFLGTIEVR